MDITILEETTDTITAMHITTMAILITIMVINTTTMTTSMATGMTTNTRKSTVDQLR